MNRENTVGVILALLGALIVFVPGALSQNVSSGSVKTADEEEIYALVIHSQMEQWVHEGNKSEAEARTESDKSIARGLNFRIFFVEVNGKDPTDDFIKRLKDVPRTIKKVSEAIPDKNPHTPVDKLTHRTGIIFSAERIRWSDKNSAELEGGYYCGALCAAGVTFKVKRENGKWVIKTSQMNWIS